MDSYQNMAAQAQASSVLGNSAREQPDFTRFMERMKSLELSAAELGSRVHSIADAVYGERDTSKGEQACAPVRCGMVGLVEDGFDRLDRYLHHAFEGMRRLEKLA